MLAWLGDGIAQLGHGSSVVSNAGVLGVLLRKRCTLATDSVGILGQGQGLKWLEAVLSAAACLTSAHTQPAAYPRFTL